MVHGIGLHLLSILRGRIGPPISRHPVCHGSEAIEFIGVNSGPFVHLEGKQ